MMTHDNLLINSNKHVRITRFFYIDFIIIFNISITCCYFFNNMSLKTHVLC